jgi:signal transduction histidine kinase
VRSTRTRVAVFFVVLMAATAMVSTLAIREVLELRLDQHVTAALDQEVLELDRLVTVGRDPSTGARFDSARALFDVYFERNVPGNEEAFLAYVDGELHRSALARFPLESLPGDVLDRWQAIARRPMATAQDASGSYHTESGTGRYRIARVSVGAESGAFVVTMLPSAELRKIGELQTYGVAATLLTVLVASVIAWFAVGRVLAPVSALTETARSISESDMSCRIEVRGDREAAEMARSFNAMLDRIEAVVRSQREFVEDASHELRGPLTICRGHLETLGDDPAERRAATALVLDEFDRMARIVDDLQVLAETEQPDFVDVEDIDVMAFTFELLAKVGALGPRPWLLDEAGEGVVRADRFRLTQAVVNLALNAVHHTAPDEPIALGTRIDDRQLRLWVRDEGRGIPASERERIFQRFVRGRDGRNAYRGAGLGLAIVKAVAEAHGGRVELVSRLDTGSTFTLVIPVHASTAVASGSDPDR